MYEKIPDDLKKIPNWVCYQLVNNNGQEKQRKIPVDPKTGLNAKSNDSSTWGTFDQAIIGLKLHDCHYPGIMFQSDVIWGIDIDHCIGTDGMLSDEAKDIIAIMDSYTEISPSGTGIHILTYGHKPSGGCRKGNVEMYDTGRGFTVTGNCLGKPRTIRDCTDAAAVIHRMYIEPEPKTSSRTERQFTRSEQAVIDTMLGCKNGKEIRALMDGDWSRYESQSEGDLALCNHLAFFTGKDIGMMDAIFRRSGLFRQKWDERHGDHTYGDRTIMTAINGQKKFCDSMTTNENRTICSDDASDLICFSDIPSEQIEWLWYPYIAKGKITIIAGDPGSGKTFISTVFASIVSNGSKFPGETTTERTAASVIFQNGEDGAGDTIKPRLEKAGANITNIYCFDETKKAFSLQDISRLQTQMRRLQPVLIVIDPVQAYLGAKLDMHRANEVRPILAALARVGSDFQCAIVVVMHLNKGTGQKDLYRILGSVDFVGAARSVLLIGENQKVPGERLMIHIKSSLGKTGKAQSFTITDEGIRWLGERDATERDITCQTKKTDPDSALGEAMRLIQDSLFVSEKYANALEQEVLNAGISKRTFQRARDELRKENKIHVRKHAGGWVWKWKIEGQTDQETSKAND